MTEDPRSTERLVGNFPETIGPNDLPNLNRALEVLFTILRDVRGTQTARGNERAAVFIALKATTAFLELFRPVSMEALHVPLVNLASALAALDHNTVEPVLTRTKRPGRGISSQRRFALMGIAVGAAHRLELTGIGTDEANKQVAKKLAGLGIKPMRGSGNITARTIRDWRERIEETSPLRRGLQDNSELEISDEDLGWIRAADHTEQMVTEEWTHQIQAMLPAKARKLILDALEQYIRWVEQ
jgi:hypothetical protein